MVAGSMDARKDGKGHSLTFFLFPYFLFIVKDFLVGGRTL